MMTLILQCVCLALLGGILFAFIGIIPGTDETATMAPLTLIVVLLGFPPQAVFCWFIAIAASMHITHIVPTAMAALPGSTMSVPMVNQCVVAKKLGVPHIALKKMATASLMGAFIAVPVAVAFATILSPFGDMIKPYIGLIFTLAAILLAWMSTAKLGAILALLPFAFLIQGMQYIATQAVGTTLFVSIFMGITIGPMISEIFNVFVPKIKQQQMREGKSEVVLAPDNGRKGIPNPFQQLTKGQGLKAALGAAISACTFTFSPVGMTVMLGELLGGSKKGVYENTMTSLCVKSAVSNATYMGELLIPLIAFGLPLSPVALGPGAPLFNAPPRFTLEPMNNLHTLMSAPEFLAFGIIGILFGAVFSYLLSVKYARSWTEKIFRCISHEALIGAFLGLIVMLAYYEAGILGVAVAATVGLFGGIMHNIFGVHTGIQFMAYYASGWIVGLFL